MIAFGRAAALGGPDADRVNRGIATIHGYTEVTIEFIAYVAMLVSTITIDVNKF